MFHKKKKKRKKKKDTNSYVSYFELKASIISGNSSSNPKAQDWNEMGGLFGQTFH